ncbi:MAG: CZB domain-containing protein [Candidatus Polarisedimenticolaceae bacterium]|nr:CZB domain-containing protein [Candidatus Polarisedimenticolaceae bacterium]
MQNGYLATWNGVDSPEAHAVGVDHHNCRLGKWYYEGLGKECFSTTSAYQKLEMPHGIVHQKVQEGLKGVSENWQKDENVRLNVIQSFTDAELASEQVMQCMSQMANEKSVA